MPSVRLVNEHDPGSLGTIVRHLWTPLLESGLGRVVVGRHAQPGWRKLHSFTMQPYGRSPRLIVSVGRGNAAAARALSGYRLLRAPAAQGGRLAIAGKVLMGSGANDVVSVEARDPIKAAQLEPVSVMEKILGRRLLAVVGIRDSANGKATLQLFDSAGWPASYAKLAWNAHTAAYVRTEISALKSVTFARERTRVPHLLAAGSIGGDLPYVMTEPLPPSVRRVTGEADLSAVEVARLFRPVRRGQLSETAQFRDVLARLSKARRSYTDTELGSLADRLVTALHRVRADLPVMERWHGDLVPWNTALDADRTLWLWDWESSEPDAAAGLDVLHWLLNSRRPAGASTFVSRLKEASNRAGDAFDVLGIPEHQRGVVTAGYALTFAERNWSLAATNGGWARHRVGRDATADLLRFGISLASRMTHTGRSSN